VTVAKNSRDVVDLSRGTAAVLRLGGAERRSVEFVAMLHDVGKISMPKKIINKPGKLDDEEMKIIRLHTVVGEHMLIKAGGALARCRNVRPRLP
jgi:HD-GYP domain-containing protein (c-di-GMP phosphodiesterase class II)